MFKPIPKEDIVIRPFKAYKNYTLTKASATPDIVRNLTASFDTYTSNISSGSGKVLNEYALNKSIRALYYKQHPQLVATVYNWDFGKHSNKTLYDYQITSSNGLVTYRYFYDATQSIYVNQFNDWLSANKYSVNSRGEIYTGVPSDITKMYGTKKSYGSLTERQIGNRYFAIQISQSMIGEGINPGSVSLTDYNSGKTFVDDGFCNLVYSDDTNTQVGNVFYANGIITITYKTENPSDIHYAFGSNDFLLKYQSTKTIYENEVFVEVGENEFNTSTNPSATVNYNGGTYVKSLIKFSNTGSGTSDIVYDFRISSSNTFTYATIYGPAGTTKTNAIGFSDYEYSSSIDPTGSYLAPYITTIGLYDEYYDLVAVAKIPSKPKSMPDYPINFIVRFDT